MKALRTVLIGEGGMLCHCGARLLERGHLISAVVSNTDDARDWARARGIPVVDHTDALATRLRDFSFDWLLSITNLKLLPKAVLDLPQQGAINFHDGPLPRHAGLNAPIWAMLEGEILHGVCWHILVPGVDRGDVLERCAFSITEDDTALSLNAKCFEAGLQSFEQLLRQLESNQLVLSAQDFSHRSYHAGSKRPPAAARLNFSHPAHELSRLVRAMYYCSYFNPLACPKVEVDGQVYVVRRAEVANKGMHSGTPGEVLGRTDGAIDVACASGTIRLWLQGFTGAPVTDLPDAGSHMPIPSVQEAEHLGSVMRAAAEVDIYWRDKLRNLSPARAPFCEDAEGPSESDALISYPLESSPDLSAERLAYVIARLCGQDCADIAVSCETSDAKGYLCDWVPVRFNATTCRPDEAMTKFRQELDETPVGFARDLWLRDPQRPTTLPSVGLSLGKGAISVAAMTLEIGPDARVIFDGDRIGEVAQRLLVARLNLLLKEKPHSFDDMTHPLPLSEAERKLVLDDWNDTATPYEPSPMHLQIGAQAARTPSQVAALFEDQSLTYAQLDARANKIARVLGDLGVGPDVVVGLHMPRGLEMICAALAILKAGGAYVPLDPVFPADRIAHYIKDSGTPVILSLSSTAPMLPECDAEVVCVDTDRRVQTASDSEFCAEVEPENLAYVIYTSGSTGVPKGVMVEHRNVANFFAAMDQQIERDENSVWFAVTSLSFDISVLEIFYTLARGIKLVIGAIDQQALSSDTSDAAANGMDFSLYYWGNDGGPSADKYRLLMEGAKFADQNGFCAVWTPERHFHAFGGAYPNPAVTGAAIAGVTKNLAVRAGSCVAPLHHPARIAEEWAVVDNLTNGRAGIAMASGWQPDDFVLRPENSPPNNKAALYDSIKTLRRLWAGEAVEFDKGNGEVHAVITQPRPVSKSLPIWVTIAGNPDTWVEAGKLGAHVLTHLLGQKLDDVEENIRLYRSALREAGYDPRDFQITLMLHSFVAESRDAAREIARGPMKEYLRSAAGLIKQYAWAFPAFKRPANARNAFDLDLGTLDKDELDAILDYAFERYFDEAGFFGTVDDCLERAKQLKAIGVTEIACLIDFGIDAEVVLDALRPLAEVVAACRATVAPDNEDFSFSAQMARHGVTHLQCTPSLARMLLETEATKAALRDVRHILIGGEALPGALLQELEAVSSAQIQNMYGPTETTIWSTCCIATSAPGTVPIGRPVANTRVLILDKDMVPVHVGVPGELFIGGDGVTRGYWNRDELTAERFVADPMVNGARLYRTGDLASWTSEGVLEFHGRSDDQIKLRGYRIELGEIETHLEKMNGVTQAVVLAREEVPGDVRLIAYLRGTRVPDIAAIRAKLSENLPVYMLPSHRVEVDEFPLTPNKKVDRNALAKMEQTEQKPSRVAEPEADAPALPSRAACVSGHLFTIAKIWRRLLGVEKIRAEENFFDLGGHSLLAVQVHRDVKAELDLTGLAITDIFRFPVLSAYAARVDELVARGTGTAAPDSNSPSGFFVPSPEDSLSRGQLMQERRKMRAEYAAQRRG